ncbi:UDP-N-acetylglucosamine--N-acetylmuramyl-(pentapeptide) pyrophosphoryl-undecaprenol N-acetylglucosamine transferase [bacterium]|nr:MAG: UDP-N-acetylglucosamine--N-acetylmuramyl-(pentapeptide) pyrophosphoryl-undecaprenol N-acetylglucosamine transferase [bacterium]
MTKRILLTGGVTGGHIAPLLAVADELKKVNFADIEIHYIGPKTPLNQEFLNRDIPVYRIALSKLRRYFSFANFVDIPKFVWSIFQALFRLYILMPDVVFSKGGPGAFAVVLAARFYFIPVIIHESDSVPGLTNRLSAKFAKRIGIAFETAAKYFNKNKVFISGNPIRAGLLDEIASIDAAKGNLKFKKDQGLIFIYSGSQGAVRINRFILDNLEVLLKRFQIFHQAGEKNLEEVKSASQEILKDLPNEIRERYHVAGFLDLEKLKMVFEAADAVISRAGSSSIFEIAAFGKPSILVPIPAEVVGDHQVLNAYEYAKTGAAIVIEETNLMPNIVATQIGDILDDKNRYAIMAEAARRFARPEAASIIASEILRVVS